MTAPRWRAARLDEISEEWSLADGTALGEEEALAVIGARDPRAIARWEAFEARYPGIWERLRYHDVRRRLGIRAFGVAAFSAPAGDPLVIPHSEAEEGYDQEELYVVVRGRARFVCDGEEVLVGPGEALFAAPDVHREAFALDTPTVVLVVGGTPGKAYEPPPFHLDAGPA